MSVRSRRKFLKLVALASAATLMPAAGPRRASAESAKTPSGKAPRTPSSRPPALEAEIAKQKKSTGDVLKTIRDFELPTGSEMAFVFSAERRGRRRSSAAAAPASAPAGKGSR